MNRTRILSAVAVLLLALAGCSSNPSQPAPTRSQLILRRWRFISADPANAPSVTSHGTVITFTADSLVRVEFADKDTIVFHWMLVDQETKLQIMDKSEMRQAEIVELTATRLRLRPLIGSTPFIETYEP